MQLGGALPIQYGFGKWGSPFLPFIFKRSNTFSFINLLWVTRVLLVPYDMGFVAMDDARKTEVFELLMNRPRILVGAAKRVCIAFKATPEERRAAMIAGIIPLWEWVKKGGMR